MDIKKLQIVFPLVASLLFYTASVGYALAEEHEAHKIELEGYADVHYNNPEVGTMDQNSLAQTDVHRLVFGLEYEFTERIKFEAEVEFEHAGDTIELEEAILEYEMTDNLGIRAGSLIMPIGMLNRSHKPTKYYSVERPYVERSIIPTTWQEVGVGLAGKALEKSLAYRLYLVSGLDASNFTTLDGIRGGRGAGVKSKAEDLATAGRVVYSPPSKGLSLGGSIYYGQADQGQSGLTAVSVMLFEVDSRYEIAGFDLKAEFVQISVDNADQVSVLTGETIGETMQGWYAEVGYNIFHYLPSEAGQDLVVFVRREDFNTNEEVPSGFAADPAADREIWTFGIAFYPIEKLVIKGDIEFWEDGKDDTLTRFNLGFGLVF